MRNAALALSLLTASAAAGAAPVNLQCAVASGDERKTFSVALDEQGRKVTHKDGNGETFNAEGVLSGDKITYKKAKRAGLFIVTWLYEIERTDRAAIHTYIVEVADPETRAKVKPSQTVYTGTCH